MRSLAVLLCLSLPGCLTGALWEIESDGEVPLRVVSAGYAIESLALVARDDPATASGVAPDSELVLQAERLGGGGDAALPRRPCFVLRPQQAAAAEQVALLLDGAVGEVDRCALEIDCIGDPGCEVVWQAMLHLQGWLSPRLERACVPAGEAAALLQSAAAVAAAKVEPQLAARLLAVADVDWRLLCVDAKDGHGTALACFYDPSQRIDGVDCDPQQGIDVLVQVGPADDARFALVPVVALPALAAVHRAPHTLLPRFECRRRFLPLPWPSAPPQGAPLPLPAATAMRLSSHVRGLRPHHDYVALKVLLTPLTMVADAALFVVANWIVRETKLQSGPEPHAPRR